MAKYSLSFTAASLMPFEFWQVAQEYVKSQKDWEVAKKRIIEKNILQKASSSTIKRKLQEYKKRSLALTDKELDGLIHSDEKQLYAFLSALKTYPLLYEFCIEVLRNKYHNYDPILQDRDWDDFLEAKKSVSDELARKSESTLKKAYQVIKLILLEAGIIQDKKSMQLIKPYVSKTFIQNLCEDNPKWLAGFLYSDSEIQKMCQERQ